MSNKISAVRLKAYADCNAQSWGYYHAISPKSYELLLAFEKVLSAIKDDDGTWIFWIGAERGPIEDFGNYEQLHDFGDYATYEEVKKDWLDWFPRDEYWFKITYISREGHRLVGINDRCVISTSPKESSSEWGRDYTELLSALIEEAEDIVYKLRDGTYNDWLDKALPYRYRFGVMQRKDYWALDDGNRLWDIKELPQEDIAQFIEYAACPEIDGDKPIGRIAEMTAARYFEICGYCYRAAHFTDAEAMTDKQLYCRYADTRDGRLREIEEDSATVFDKWYDTPEKVENYADQSHMWEIAQGHTHTMIHLYLRKDERGYYLLMRGGEYARTREVVQMYNALRRNNIPVYLYRYRDIADKIAGNGEVGIVPEFENGYIYWYGGFYKKGITTFVSFDEENFPDNIAEKVIELTDWKPLDKLELKE